MLIDTNCWIGRWPFQQQGEWKSAGLQKSLVLAGVSTACVASMDAVLAPHPIDYEKQTARALTDNVFPHGLRFNHTPLICDTSPNYRDDLLWARDDLGATCVRLAPTFRPGGFHSGRIRDLIFSAEQLSLRVALFLRLEDERTQSPLLRVMPPAPGDIAELAKAIRPIPLLVHNAYLSEMLAISAKQGTSNVTFDLTMIDGADPVSRAIEYVGADRLVFGSGSPLLYAPANARKLACGELSVADRERVSTTNATALLKLSLASR